MALRKEKKEALTVRPRGKEEITTRRPFDLWTDFDQMFDNFRTSLDDIFWSWRQRSGPITSMTQRRTPPVDIADHGDRYEMRLEMPGIPKDDINIEVTPAGIEVSAEHEDTTEEKGKNWLRRERSSSSFYRCLEVPEELKTDRVEAELKDGILTLSLPKVEPKPEYKAKKVKIK